MGWVLFIAFGASLIVLRGIRREGARSYWNEVKGLVPMAVLITVVGTLVYLEANQPADNLPDCDANYAGCVPLSYKTLSDGEGEYIDLDCADVDGDSFKVTGDDVHKLDEDGDGIACEPPPPG